MAWVAIVACNFQVSQFGLRPAKKQQAHGGCAHSHLPDRAPTSQREAPPPPTLKPHASTFGPRLRCPTRRKASGGNNPSLRCPQPIAAAPYTSK